MCSSWASSPSYQLLRAALPQHLVTLPLPWLLLLRFPARLLPPVFFDFVWLWSSRIDELSNCRVWLLNFYSNTNKSYTVQFITNTTLFVRFIGNKRETFEWDKCHWTELRDWNPVRTPNECFPGCLLHVTFAAVTAPLVPAQSESCTAHLLLRL